MRLAGRTLAVLNASRFQATLLPFQFGVSVPGGAEHIIHATRLIAEERPEWAVFQADFTNAFNTVSRRAILRQLFKCGYQDLVPYFLSNYGQAASLSVHMSDGAVRWLPSAEGVRQGDPLGPFFFALALQPVLVRLHKELSTEDAIGEVMLEHGISPSERDSFKRLVWDNRLQGILLDIAALLDDVRLAGHWAVVGYAARRLQALAIELETGLEYNVPKCAAWSPEIRLDRLFSSIEAEASHVRLPQDGLTVLGAPVGTAAFERTESSSTVSAHTRLLTRITQLPTLQLALLLLRYCAAQRITYLLRAVPPSTVLTAARQHDRQIMATLCALLGEDDLSDDQQLQASLRLADGGMGLGSAIRARKAAYLGSVSDFVRQTETCFPILQALRDEWLGEESTTRLTKDTKICLDRVAFLIEERQDRHPLPPEVVARDLPIDVATLKRAKRKLQQRVASLEQNLAKHELQQCLPARQQAQLLCQSGKGAAAFLSAIPSIPDLRLSNADMQLSLRRWIRLPLSKTALDGYCCCSSRSRPTRLDEGHILVCKLHGVATWRHDDLRRTLRDMAMSAGIVAEEEPRCLPGFGQGGGDILLHGAGEAARDLMVDVTVVAEDTDTHVRRSATTPYHAAQAAEERKRERYADPCAHLGIDFWPLAIELDGAFGPGLQRFFALCRQLSRDVAVQDTTWSAPTFSSYWQQRLSVVLRRGTARAVHRVLRDNAWDRAAFLAAPDYERVY